MFPAKRKQEVINEKRPVVSGDPAGTEPAKIQETKTKLVKHER